MVERRTWITIGVANIVDGGYVKQWIDWVFETVKVEWLKAV